MTDMMTNALWGLPDPDTASEFYDDVPTKRFLAWLVDLVVIGLLVAITTVLTVFIGLFFLPLLWLGIGFAYRVITMARGSATLGQRLMSLEFRNHRGERFGFGEAVLHVLLFTVSWSFVIPQVISVITILASPRAQSLYDMVQGTAAINRAAGD